MYVYQAHLRVEDEQKLRKLQEKIAELINNDARPIKYIHCTLWFGGNIERIEKSLHASGIHIEPALLEATYLQYLARLQPQTTEFTALTDGLEEFGSQGSVLALRLVPPVRMEQFYAHGRVEFINFLEDIGVPDEIMNTIHENPDWGWAFRQKYQPHISLFKNFKAHAHKLHKMRLPKELTFYETKLMEYGVGDKPREVS